MSFRFKCKSCNDYVLIQYHDEGKEMECQVCGIMNIIPGNVESVEEDEIIEYEAYKKYDKRIENSPELLEKKRAQKIIDKYYPIFATLFMLMLFMFYIHFRVSETFFEPNKFTHAIKIITSISLYLIILCAFLIMMKIQRDIGRSKSRFSFFKPYDSSYYLKHGTKVEHFKSGLYIVLAVVVFEIVMAFL